MILFDNMKHVLAACNVKASDFVGKSSAMAALCDPLGLEPNPMPFFVDSTMEKDHPRKKMPKSFLLYIRVLGVVHRSDGP